MDCNIVEEVSLLDHSETDLVAAWTDPSNPRTYSKYMPKSGTKPCSNKPAFLVHEDGRT